MQPEATAWLLSETFCHREPMAPFRKLRILLGLRKPDASNLKPCAQIGRHTYGISDSNFYNCFPSSPVTIGAFCSIAEGVLFMCQGNHPTATCSSYPLQHRLFKTRSIDEYLTTKGPINIGNDVWIGARSIVLSGVSIGDGAIIAAGSLVSKDVEPYTIVGGNPARELRLRFPQEVVESLQRIKWWEWSDEEISANRAAFDLPAAEFARIFDPMSTKEGF